MVIDGVSATLPAGDLISLQYAGAGEELGSNTPIIINNADSDILSLTEALPQQLSKSALELKVTSLLSKASEHLDVSGLFGDGINIMLQWKAFPYL